MEKFIYISNTEIEAIPRTPGVYSFHSQDELLYIGKAGNLQNRVKSHFHQSSFRDDLFMGLVDRIGFIETPSDMDALFLESKLIKQFQPKYNVVWKDNKDYFYVIITKEPLPRVLLTHQPHAEFKDSKVKVIGPFMEGRTIKYVLRSLRHIFPYYTALSHEEKPCGFCHIGLCPGPNPDPRAYRKNISHLSAVLQGKRNSVVKHIKKEMIKASQRQEFERAALLRDQFFALEKVISYSFLSRSPEEFLKTTDLHRFYGDIEKELQSILKTNHRILRIEAYDISNIQGIQATGSMVTFFKGKPAKNLYRKFKIRIAGKPNDYAMLQEMVARRLTHTEWGYPSFMLIDGGRGQLSAVEKILEQSKRKNILIGALAKQHNELFLPKRSKPVLLRDISLRTRNVLLHIRDEAHRFAITYHRKLRRVDLLGEKR